MISFLLRRFRWMLVGAVGRELTRRLTARQVDEATQSLAEKLPERAVRVADALPGDLLRTAGTAQVATRTAIRSAQRSRGVVQASRDAISSPERARQRLGEMEGEWREAVAEEDLSFRARLIAHTRGATAATDVLLGGRTSWEDQPLPEVPPAVGTGRRTRSRVPLIGRMQRSYRPRQRGWE